MFTELIFGAGPWLLHVEREAPSSGLGVDPNIVGVCPYESFLAPVVLAVREGPRDLGIKAESLVSG